MWIELHDSSRDHPKLVKVARDLGMPKVHVLGHLCSLWTWVLRMAPDGDLSSFDDEDIEIGAEWEGEAGALVAALTRRGLLDRGEHGLTVHDWAIYATHIKAADRKRAERVRKRTESRDVTACHVTSRDVTGQRRISGPVTLTEPNRTEPNRQNRTEAEATGADARAAAPGWPDSIATMPDLESAASEWGWQAGGGFPARVIGRARRILDAGAIQRHEYESAREKATNVAHFLGIVEGQRTDAAKEASKASPPPRAPESVGYSRGSRPEEFGEGDQVL